MWIQLYLKFHSVKKGIYLTLDKGQTIQLRVSFWPIKQPTPSLTANEQSKCMRLPARAMQFPCFVTSSLHSTGSKSTHAETDLQEQPRKRCSWPPQIQQQTVLCFFFNHTWITYETVPKCSYWWEYAYRVENIWMAIMASKRNVYMVKPFLSFYWHIYMIKYIEVSSSNNMWKFASCKEQSLASLLNIVMCLVVGPSQKCNTTAILFREHVSYRRGWHCAFLLQPTLFDSFLWPSWGFYFISSISRLKTSMHFSARVHRRTEILM